MRLIAVAALIALAVFLSLNRDPAQAMWDDYASRLERVLERPIALTPLPPRKLLAPLDVRRQPLPQTRTSLTKALSLGPCGLVPLIAAHNNSLGKVAPTTAELSYTQQALTLARTCRADPAVDPGLIEELDRFIDHRQRLWPLLLSNATDAAPELASYLAASARALGPNEVEQTGLGGLDDYVQQLRSAADGQPIDMATLEAAAQRVQAAPTGGQWINSHRLAVHTLTQLTAALASSELCTGPRTAEQRTLARNVFESIYLGRVQPMLAVLARRGQQLDGLLSDAVLAVDWHPDQLAEAAREHAQGWKHVLKRCGLPIGTTG